MLLSNSFILMCLFFLSFTLVPSINAEVTANPHGIMVYADSGDVQEYELTLANEGDADVNYSLNLFPQLSGDENAGMQPRRDDRGGPDDATVEWRDSNEKDCPPYQWIDISEFEDV